MEILFDKKSILPKGKRYIQQFKDRIFIAKYGGSNIDNEKISQSIIEDVVYLNQQGIKIAVVHGGGSAITRLMHERGKEVKFVEGSRVTDEETALIADDALNGVNRDIVKRMTALEADAVSVTGKEHGIIRAKKKEGLPAGDFLGDVDFIETRGVLELLDRHAIPVISPIGTGKDGKLYNINADSVSAEIAIALNAEKLIFLTNVKGIMTNHLDEKTLVTTVTEEKIEGMIKQGIIGAGMIPKARASIRALSGGVRKVHIISGNIRHALLIEVFTDEGIGTEIVH